MSANGHIPDLANCREDFRLRAESRSSQSQPTRPLGANFVAKVVVASSQATPLRSKGFDIARYSVGSSGFDAQLALTPSTQRYLTLKLHTQRTAEAVARSAWRAAAGSVRWPQVWTRTRHPLD